MIGLLCDRSVDFGHFLQEESSTIPFPVECTASWSFTLFAIVRQGVCHLYGSFFGPRPPPKRSPPLPQFEPVFLPPPPLALAELWVAHLPNSGIQSLFHFCWNEEDSESSRSFSTSKLGKERFRSTHVLILTRSPRIFFC